MAVGNQDSKSIGELKANIASTLENISVILGTGAGEEELTLEEQVRNALQNILAGGEEDEGGFNLMALLRGGDKEGLAGKGGLGALAGLLGGLNGQEEGENPLTALFGSTYQQYLHGNGEEILGLIPTSEKALQDIQQAYDFALHGGGEDDNATLGILPAKDASLLEIDQSRNDTLRQIEAAGKKILSEIQDSVRRAIDGMIGHIARLVAGVIGVPVGGGGRGGSSGNYTA